MCRNPLAMGLQKLLGCLARVIPRSIMDQKQVLRGVGQDHLYKRLITVRGKPVLEALIEQAPRKILNSAKHFVAFALATAFDCWLLSATPPRQSRPHLQTGSVLCVPWPRVECWATCR